MSYDTDIVRVMWYETVSSGMSGVILPPANATIITELWKDEKSVLISSIVNSLPNLEAPLTSGGTLVEATLDAEGNYVLLDEPANYPIALVYIYEVAHQDFDKNHALFGQIYQGNIDNFNLHALGAQSEDLNMNSHQVVALSVPDAAGEAIRQTAKITETALEDAVDKKHDRSHSIVGTSDHSDVANFVDGPLSPGVLTGGFISKGTVGTVTVSEITALVRTDIATTDPLVYVELAEQANLAIGSADTKYHVGLDYNGGVPQILVQTANFNRTTEIGLGTCMKDTSVPVRTHFSNGGMRHQDGVSKLQQRASTLRRTELAPGGGGCAIADVGGGSLQFSIQSGIVYHGIYRMTPFDAPPYDPYISGDDGYFLVYGDTATGFTISDGTDTAINNTQYWNTTTHALDNVTVNQYACHWVYIHTDDEDVYVVLGDDSYKLAEAQLAQPLSDLPIEISEFGLFLGCIIVERNATAFELVQMVTDTFFTGLAVGIHNSMGGLNDGDYKHLTAAEKTLFDTIEENADVTDAVNIASSIVGVAGKTTPADADTIPIIDSAASNVLKKLTWANVKATLKTYFDTLYNKYVLENHAPTHTDGTDDIQSATNAQKGVATTAQVVRLENLNKYIVSTGETLTIKDGEQSCLVEQMQIEGTGTLDIEGTGILTVAN